MKAVVVAGQYAVGKTETIKGLIRSAGKYEQRIGAFVAESANIALDQERYGIGANAFGFSFASVCCPTLSDMRQAINVAMSEKKYDLLFLEPPGNMHPPLMAQIAIEKGFSLEHVVMLISQRDFDDDRHTTTFHSGIEIADIVGITHTGSKPLRRDILDMVRSENPHAKIIPVSKGDLKYELIQNQPKWDLGKLSGLPEFALAAAHSDHYQKVLRVFNPELSYEDIHSLLAKIADTGLVERGKGRLPKYNRQIDIKRKFLEITTQETVMPKEKMGYLICFGKEELPITLIDQLAIAPEQKTRELFENAPLESKFAIFGKLYKESAESTKKVISNGEVTYTYSPLDEAEKVAMEIYADSKDDSAIRMILPIYHGTRLNALKELKGRPAAQNAFAGVHISSVLINTSLGSGGHDGMNYPKIADQHQLLEIKDKAIPALFLYSSNLKPEQIKDFPRYESAIGGYIFKAATTAWDSIDGDKKQALGQLRAQAKDNMSKIHNDSNFAHLAKLWGNWGN